MRHVVMEIEEGSLTLTIADCEKRDTRVEVCKRIAIKDLSRVVLSSAIKTVISEIREDFAGVHVVLGERRFQHFVAEVPRLGPEEVRAFVLREAHRMGSLPTDVELLGHCWHLGKLPARRQRLATICLAQNAWQPIERAIQENGLQVLSLTSMEDAITAAIPPHIPQHTAVLEISANKARFILCDGSAVMQARRFMLPASHDDDDDTMLAAQLAMEVPRTLDYLEEIGCRPPEGLLISHRVPGDEDSLPLIGETQSCMVRYEPEFSIAEEQAMPGLATAGVLTRLATSRGPIRSLLGGLTVSLPRSPWPIAAALLAIAVGASGGAFGLIESKILSDSTATLETTRVEVQQLETAIAQRENAASSDQPLSLEQSRLLGVLNTRRPVSLLLSSLSDAASENVAFEKVGFDTSDRVTLTGRVSAGNRLDALMAFTRFIKNVREIPFLESDGREDIRDATGSTRELLFKINLFWRVP